MRRGLPRGGRGFTLVEILIVISLISLLMSLSIGGVIIARRRAKEACARAFIHSLAIAADRYFEDTGQYPGAGTKDAANAFPALFAALYTERPPRGKGGPSGPYMQMQREDLAVPGEDGAWEKATTEDLLDPRVPKHILDPWGRPYIYRENRSRPKDAIMMRPASFDLYSTGNDGIDGTGKGEPGDDVGVW
jgi:prepilin-type N-terminal cleavage/methylation domain-containing protein